jgi:NADH-quinone oxidoreductase subunit L
MTFFGESRLNAAAQHQLHEAPTVMTAPLAVLGVLSVVGGVVNLPHFVNGSTPLERWLRPVFAVASQVRPVLAPANGMELPLVGIAVLVALVGLAIGWRLTTGATIVPAADAVPDRGFGAALAHRLYVDEIYDRLVVQPVVWTARTVLWRGVDRTLVDGVAVNGLARIFEGAGWLGSRLQTGQLGLYIVLFAAGAVWLLAAMLG